MPSVLSDRNDTSLIQASAIKALSKFHDFDFSKYKGKQSRLKIARNLVDYEAGKTILDTVMGIRTKQNINQTELF